MRSIREIKTILTNGDLDEKLAYLYCRDRKSVV